TRVEMRDLVQRMNAGVRPSGAVHRDGSAGDEAHGSRERALDAAARLLDLPAYEIRSVVFESQCDSRHRGALPLKTRRRSSPRMAELPQTQDAQRYACNASISPCASRRWLESPSSSTSW